MSKHPDVLGFELSEAIILLEQNNVGYIVTESIGKVKLEDGITRVISQNFISDNETELIISYF